MRTQKISTLDELRSEVNRLQVEVDNFRRFFKPIEQLDKNGKRTDCLIASYAGGSRLTLLEAIPEDSWINEKGALIIEAEEIRE